MHHVYDSQVIDEIECFWDKSSEKYKKRRNSSLVESVDGSDREIDMSLHYNEISVCSQQIKQQRRESIRKKINLLNEMNRSEFDFDNGEIAIDTIVLELEPTHKALYAETISNVCVIFADIVNFSHMSLSMKPIEVMNLLQDLFCRFDALCDQYGMQKLEVIADTFICTTDMFDKNKNQPPAAENALNLAKQMVRESNHVTLNRNRIHQELEIRVGVHIGDLTCGVLGERLPKFTVL